MKDREEQRKYTREHYRNNKEEYQRKRDKLRKRYRKEFKDYKKTLSCSKCPENHTACIEFHHLDPSKKEYTISTKGGYAPLRTLLKEIKKCSVLCSNCHAKLHWEDS